jgi:ATP-dependent helicase/nuclease subunit A
LSAQDKPGAAGLLHPALSAGYSVARAEELLSQLDGDRAAGNARTIAPTELAATVTRTLQLPQIAELRPRLLPERTIYGRETCGNEETLISGIADALALAPDSTIDVVVDWKSDVDPDTASLAPYRAQLGTYRAVTGTSRALLVMMTAGKVIEVS